MTIKFYIVLQYDNLRLADIRSLTLIGDYIYIGRTQDAWDTVMTLDLATQEEIPSTVYDWLRKKHYID